MENKWRKRIGIIVLIICITIGLIWLETFKRQCEQFSLAETSYNQQDYPRAINYYDAAIHMYTPWSSRVKKSADRLWAIGKMYEDQSDYDMALIAYRNLRSSFYAVRWLIQPYPEWISKCDTAIARVLKLQKRNIPAEKTEPADNAQSQ